ncbi:hypothetical protein ACWZHB_33085 [Nocardia sp. FBN12]|uniref:hypothetical protein n=1 Tax=Nocardia sp. FBN12 TaxID=3419766 RepID=UPI003CFECC63
MGARVCTDRELVAVTELVLDPILVGRLLNGFETERSHYSTVGRVGEPGRRIGSGNVVADRAEVIRTQWSIRRAARQAHVGTQIVCQVECVLLQVQLQVSGIRVSGQFEIDQELVPTEEVLDVIERGIDCVLGEFDLLAQFRRGHQMHVGDVGTDGGYRDPTVADLEAANSVGGARLRRILVRTDGGCPAVV